MYFNMTVKKLFVLLTAGFLFSLKAYSSISLYGSQISTLKNLFVSVGMAKDNFGFHLNQFKKRTSSPLALKINDEPFIVGSEIAEIESYLDDELGLEESAVVLNKESFSEDLNPDRFVNDEDEIINKILSERLEPKKNTNEAGLAFYDLSKKKFGTLQNRS